jgi:carbamate kinase
VVEDAGRGFRRVVPSPKPAKIIELDTVKSLLTSGTIVIAAGGGGIPVIEHDDGSIQGIEAVIDKDFAASLMAKGIGADRFIISTAVEQVCINFGQPDQTALDTITVAEAEKYMEEGHFAPGSMLPKIQAMINFVRETGNAGLITDPAHLDLALKGEAGTKIVP